MFKRTLSLIICIIVLISSFTATALTLNAATYTGTCGTGVIWTLDIETGVLTISGNGAMKDYPSTSTTTGAPWSSYLSYIKSVVVEEGVTHMGAYAFVGCTNLESVSIPKSVKSMGYLGFNNTPALKSIYITDMEAWCKITRVDGTPMSSSSYSSQYDLYLDGELVTDLVIPDTVTFIENHSFWQISSIKTVVIPNSVTKIEKSAFSYCKSLTDVKIGHSVKTIDVFAFSNCTSLSTVFIPKSVTSIETYVFSIGSSTDASTQNKNVTIQCFENSTAHTYAKNKGFNYELLSTHSFTDYTYFDATCTEDAYEIAYCDYGCGTTDIIVKESALGHSFTDYICIEHATCLSDAVESAVCGNGCGTVDTRTIEKSALGHRFTKYIYDENETCFSNGTTTAVCDNGCGTTDVRTITGTMLEHSYTNYVVTQELTCTQDGIKEARCDNGCGEKDVIVEKAQGHKSSGAKVLEEPTYYLEGTEVQYCTVCYKMLNIEKIHMLIYKGFPDVWNNSWYAEGIEYCFKHGYILGCDDGTFKPNAELTREQFVTILARVEGADLSEYTNSPFIDVNAKTWYGSSVIWASTEGFVKGIGDGCFGVGKALTREQLAVILYRYAEAKGMDMTKKSDLTYCNDLETISTWATDSCAWAIKAKLLGSTSETENLISPKMTVTRAQAAKIFMSFDSIK
ncbi:MAG: hypothetical protein E7591_04640 [Ruminococcaceae bacterium]|nr:hypothetical protein [Oscillospiraceae bacterium]